MKFFQTMDIAGIVIVNVEGELNYANRDNVRNTLFEASGVNPVLMKKKNKGNSNEELNVQSKVCE